MSDDGQAQERSLDEIAAEIRALSGVTDDDPRRRRHLNICNAIRDGGTCAACAKTLKAGEPVWRSRILISQRAWNYWAAPHCKACAAKSYDQRNFESKPKPCGGCGRPVYNIRRYDRRQRLVFCCEPCRGKAVSAAARQQRTQARGNRKCDVCGKTFTPTRTDAKFCSSPCRQNAYRHRVTDSKAVLRRNRKSRNGDTESPRLPAPAMRREPLRE